MYLSNKSKGVGLVDLLMGIIIICIVLGGFVCVMINSSKEFQVGYNLTQLQRRGHYNFLHLSQDHHNADYRIFATITRHDIFKNYLNIIPPNAKVIAGTTEKVNDSDTITITYPMTKQNMFNCMAVTAPLNHMVESVLFVTENHELACAALKSNLLDHKKVDIIVEGVEAMRVHYGEDLDGDGIANRYVAADFNGLSLARIVSIKLSLLLRTPEKASLMLDTKYYTLQDIELGPYNDHYLRKVYTTILPISGLPQSSQKPITN